MRDFANRKLFSRLNGLCDGDQIPVAKMPIRKPPSVFLTRMKNEAVASFRS